VLAQAEWAGGIGTGCDQQQLCSSSSSNRSLRHRDGDCITSSSRALELVPAVSV